MNRRALAFVLCAACSIAAWAAPPLEVQDPMRGPTPIADETDPPLISPIENKDIKRMRTYSMQPPTIPHSIDGYQNDKNFNRCLACHARVNTEETQAPPLSVTHYMDRDSNVLAEVSPRRYFCVQCHVPQAEAKPLVSNTYQDIDVILKRLSALASGKK